MKLHRIIATASGTALLMGTLLGGFTTTAFAQTAKSSQLGGSYTNPQGVVLDIATPPLNRQLVSGMSGADVALLQQFLQQFPDIYPEGMVTGYYGTRTAAAVKRYQTAHELPATGNVGPKTLALINADISAMVAPPATPASTTTSSSTRSY